MKSYKISYAALLVAETAAIMGFGISFPVIPLFLEEDIGITDPVKLKTWVGLVQSAGAITLAVFAPIWGHLADVYSRRAMLLRAMFGGAIVISLMAFVHAPWQLLVLRCIQGCLTGTVAAATVLTAGIAPPAQLAFALGMLQTGIAAGNSLGPLVGGVISDFFGHRIAFMSTSLVLALAGLIILKWVEDDFKPAPSLAEKAQFRLIPDIKPIAASPLLITMMLVTFGVQAANAVAIPMLPLFLKSILTKAAEQPHYIGSSTGIVLGVGAAFAALASVLVGKCSYKVGYWKTLVICLAAGTIFTLPQAMVSNVHQLTVLRAMSSFFIGGAMPVINAIIAGAADKQHQGTVYGFNSSVSSAGAALGPMIGSLTALMSYRMLFVVSALILGLSTVEVIKRWNRKIGEAKNEC